MIKLTFNLFFLFLLTFAFACGSPEETASSQSALSDSVASSVVTEEKTTEEKATIAVMGSISILADWVENVGGDRVEVKSVVPEGVDPHSYKMGAKDISVISDSDIVFVVGLGYEESWLAKLLSNDDDINLVKLGTFITPVKSSNEDHHGHGHGEDHDKHDEHDEDGDEEHEVEKKYDDPHFWFDPVRVAVLIDVIAHELTALDVVSSDYYKQNASVYKEKVAEMDSYVMAEFTKVEGASFMTTHDSLSYLEDRYPVNIVGSIVPTLQDSDQLNPADLVEAIETVKDNSVLAILVADTVSDRFARAMAEEVDVKVVSGLNVEGLVGEGDTYIEFMKRNTNVIVNALSD